MEYKFKVGDKVRFTYLGIDSEGIIESLWWMVENHCRTTKGALVQIGDTKDENNLLGYVPFDKMSLLSKKRQVFK